MLTFKSVVTIILMILITILYNIFSSEFTKDMFKCKDPIKTGGAVFLICRCVEGVTKGPVTWTQP